MNWNKSAYLASWPKALPYPYAIARSKSPVPNRSSVDWPQAQWAPLYLPPGSPSVQPYRYPENGPLKSIVPKLRMARATNFGTKRPPGDLAAVPGYFQHSSYADVMEEYSGPDCGCGGYGCAGDDCDCGCAKKNPEIQMWHVAAAAVVAYLGYRYFYR
jgi:hypothetical protein